MSIRKKLVIATHEFRPKRGGIAVYAEELAAVCDAYDLTLWAPRHTQLNQTQYQYDIKPLPIKGTHDPSCVMKTAYAFWRNLQGDNKAILCLIEPGPIIAAMFLQLIGSLRSDAVVLVLHGSEIQRFGRSPIWRALFRVLLRKARRIALVSDYNRKELNRLFPGHDAKCVIAPGALRSDLARMDSVERSEGDKPVVLLTVGRIHPRKGQLAVVEALAMMDEPTRSSVIYRVVGSVVDSEYAEMVIATAKKTGVTLEWVGEVKDNDLAEYYHSADLFVLSSMPYKQSIEGYGMVYLEAGNYGLPSVAHRIGGVPEAVLHNETGLLADPSDRQDLSNALGILVNNKVLRESMGAKARKFARMRSWSDNVNLLFKDL